LKLVTALFISLVSILLSQVGEIGVSFAAISPNWVIDPQPSALTSGTLEPSIVAISCAQGGFCGAVTSDGRFVRYVQGVGRSGIFGSMFIDETASLNAISCPTGNFCVAVDGEGNLLSGDPAQPTSWKITKIDGGNSLISVSCASASSCAAIDASGNFLSSLNLGNLQSWVRDRIPGQSIYSSLKCPSADLCFVGDIRGNLWSGEFRNSSWNWSWLLSNSNVSISSIDCHGTSLCAFADTEGGVGVWSGGSLATWVHTQVARSALAAVSCGSNSSCISVGVNGVVWSTTNASIPTTWNRVARISDPHANSSPWASLSAASCWSDGGCILGDRTGDTATEGASAKFWRVRQTTELGTSRSIECLSVQQCISIDGEQKVLSSSAPFRTSDSWDAVRVEGAEGGFLVDASCQTTSACVAVDSFGSIFESGDQFKSWSIEPVNLGVAFTSVTCGAETFCVATSSDGSVFVGDPSRSPAWRETQLEPIGTGAQLTSVSCATNRLCAAVDDVGNIFVSVDPASGSGTWTPEHVVGITALQSVSCVTPVAFCAAVGPSHELVWSYSPAIPGTWITTLTGYLQPTAAVANLSCLEVTEKISCTVAVGNLVQYASFTPVEPPILSASMSPDGPAEDVSCFARSTCIMTSQHGFSLKTIALDLRSQSAVWRLNQNQIQVNWSQPLASSDSITLIARFNNGKITRVAIPSDQTAFTISNRDRSGISPPTISIVEQWIVGKYKLQATFNGSP
jgi:hypothetical protein